MAAGGGFIYIGLEFPNRAFISGGIKCCEKKKGPGEIWEKKKKFLFLLN